MTWGFVIVFSSAMITGCHQGFDEMLQSSERSKVFSKDASSQKNSKIAGWNHGSILSTRFVVNLY